MDDRNILLIKGAEEILSYVLPDEKDTSGIMVKVGWVRDVLALLKEQQERIETLESLRRIEQKGRLS